jgi:biotin carboxyl carrier protein
LVKVGEAVKENQPLVVLDAMKMDTYVNSSRDGIVASVDCAVGDSVSLGQQLLTLE